MGWRRQPAALLWNGRFAKHSFSRRRGTAYSLDFFISREATRLLFGERESAIDGDLEDTGDPRYQLHFGALPLQHIPRTEGTWLIVSRLAPFYSDFHSTSPY